MLWTIFLCGMWKPLADIGTFLFAVLSFCDAWSELDGSLGESARLRQTQLESNQTQQYLLSDSTRKTKVGLQNVRMLSTPDFKRRVKAHLNVQRNGVEEWHNILVKKRKSRFSPVIGNDAIVSTEVARTQTLQFHPEFAGEPAPTFLPIKSQITFFKPLKL